MRYLGTNLRTHLAKHIADQQLRRLIFDISAVARYISLVIKDAERGKAGTENVYGEEQLALDLQADKILRERFRESMLVHEFASEEQDQVVTFGHLKGNFSVAVDPLDGSSLVDVNLAIGTIIGIHRSENLLTPNSLVAAMYITYGPLTTLVYAAEGSGVHEFVLNPAGEYIISKENIKLQDKGGIYSPGGLELNWTEGHKRYIEWLRENNYKLRYSGGMVPDVHQVLMKGGGVFTYPALTDAPQGKLRLLFECQPLGYIATAAGGMATDGTRNILDIQPDTLDQRTPIYIGSTTEVSKAAEFLAV